MLVKDFGYELLKIISQFLYEWCHWCSCVKWQNNIMRSIFTWFLPIRHLQTVHNLTLICYHFLRIYNEFSAAVYLFTTEALPDPSVLDCNLNYGCDSVSSYPIYICWHWTKRNSLRFRQHDLPAPGKNHILRIHHFDLDSIEIPLNS